MAINKPRKPIDGKKARMLSRMPHKDRQAAHFDLARAQRYEAAHDYRSRTFRWMVRKSDLF